MLDKPLRDRERAVLADPGDEFAAEKLARERRRSRPEEVADVLTFDLAEHVGFAIGSVAHTLIASGVLDCRLLEDEHPGARYVRFGKLVAKLATQFGKPRKIAWERVVSIGSSRASAVLYSFESRVVEYAYVHGVEVATIMPATLKKVATGDGRAQKDAMTRVAEERWKKRVKRHDEADALCVLGWVWDTEATPRG